MAYVDPSRVQFALRFAELATRSPAEREPATDDLRVFLAALWADATGAGRTRYSAAMGRVPGAAPWSAMVVPMSPPPALPGEAVRRGPAVVELLLGQEDPDDEGVPGYRLRAGDAKAEQVLSALYGWDTEVLSDAAASSGWRLQEDESGNVAGVSRSPQQEPAEEPAADADAGEGEALPPPPQDTESDAPGVESSGSVWKYGAVAAGFAALGFVAWKWG